MPWNKLRDDESRSAKQRVILFPNLTSIYTYAEDTNIIKSINTRRSWLAAEINRGRGIKVIRGVVTKPSMFWREWSCAKMSREQRRLKRAIRIPPYPSIPMNIICWNWFWLSGWSNNFGSFDTVIDSFIPDSFRKEQRLGPRWHVSVVRGLYN